MPLNNATLELAAKLTGVPDAQPLSCWPRPNTTDPGDDRAESGCKDLRDASFTNDGSGGKTGSADLQLELR